MTCRAGQPGFLADLAANGENFDDQVKQDHVAGQNGVGISLVRMVSNFFRVTTNNKGQTYKKLFSVHDDVKKMIRSFKLSPEDFEKVILYYDEHGSFKDCALLTNNHLSQLQPLMEKTFMIEIQPDLVFLDEGGWHMGFQ